MSETSKLFESFNRIINEEEALKNLKEPQEALREIDEVETYKNRNGQEYEIIDTYMGSALLYNSAKDEYVVATGFNKEKEEWLGGIYIQDKGEASDYWYALKNGVKNGDSWFLEPDDYDTVDADQGIDDFMADFKGKTSITEEDSKDKIPSFEEFCKIYKKELDQMMSECNKKTPEDLKESDGWIGFYQGKQCEVTKDEANNLYSAKLVAIKKLNVPKNKESMVAIEPAWNDETEYNRAVFQEAEKYETVEDLSTREGILKALIEEEENAINSYNTKLAMLKDMIPEEDYTKAEMLFNHIIPEEEDHKEELTKYLETGEVELTDAKDSSIPEEPEQPEESIIEA